MKKPTSKTRRKYLNAFLKNPNDGAQSAVNLWRGVLPHSRDHPQGYEYWIRRYYYVYYRGKKPWPDYNITPLSEEDYEYIRSLVNIDPFLSDEENKEYIV